MTEQQRETGRQELFSLMRQEHGVTCMESELTDIEQCVLSYALSHAEGEAPFAYCFTDVNGRPSELTGPPEHAAPEDLRVITPLFKRSAPPVAAEPYAWAPEGEDNDSSVIAFGIEDRDDYEREGITMVPLFKGRPAPQVAVPEQRDDMIPEHFNVDECRGFRTGYNHLRAMLDAAPTAPAGEPEKPRINVGSVGHAEQLVSDPDGLPGTPRPMSTAPRDGTMVRLLVQFTNHGVNDGFDSGPAWTIGANTYDDSGDDEWHIAGWDWQQDCFTAGEGEPLGWLPMLSAPAPDEREIAVIRQLSEIARNSDCEVEVMHDDYVDITRFETDIAEHIADWLDKQADVRLRAGKEGEQS